MESGDLDQPSSSSPSSPIVIDINDKQVYKVAVDRKLNAIKRFDELDKNIFKLYNAVKGDNTKRQLELSEIEKKQREYGSAIEISEKSMDSMSLYYVNEKVDLIMMIEEETKRQSVLQDQLSEVAYNINAVSPRNISSSVNGPLTSHQLLTEIRDLQLEIEKVELEYQQLQSTWDSKRSLLNHLIQEKSDHILSLNKKLEEKEKNRKNLKDLESIIDGLLIKDNKKGGSSVETKDKDKDQVSSGYSIDSFINSIEKEKEKDNKSCSSNSGSGIIGNGSGSGSGSSIGIGATAAATANNGSGTGGSTPTRSNTPPVVGRALTRGTATSASALNLNASLTIPPPPMSPDASKTINQYPLTIKTQSNTFISGITYTLELDTISTLKQRIYDYLLIESPSSLWNMEISSPHNLSLKTLSNTFFASDSKVYLKYILYFSDRVKKTGSNNNNNQDDGNDQPIIYVVNSLEETEFTSKLSQMIDGYLDFYQNANQESVYFRTKMITFLDNIQKERNRLDDTKCLRNPQSRFMRVKSMAFSSSTTPSSSPPNQSLSSSSSFLNRPSSPVFLPLISKSSEINNNNNNHLGLSGSTSPSSWKSCSPSRGSPIAGFINGKDPQQQPQQQLVVGQNCTIRVFITKDIIKTFVCHVQTLVGELIDNLFIKFSKFINMSEKNQDKGKLMPMAEMKSKYVVKIRGLEIYLVNPTIPLSSIDFINTKSRRQKKVDLILIDKSTISKEILDSSINFNHFDVIKNMNSKIDKEEKVNNLSLSYMINKPFKLRLGSLKNFDTRTSPSKDKSIYVACQVYQCGIKIGEEFCTAPIVLVTNPSWLKWMEGPAYNHIPSNAILCIQVRYHPSNTTVGWVNFKMWDYRGRINSGFHQLCLWMDDTPDHIGTLYENKQHLLSSSDGNEANEPPAISFEIELSSPAIIYQHEKLEEIPEDSFEDEELSFSEMQRLTSIIEKDPLTGLTVEERELCWKHRHYCKFIPRSTSKVILSVPWNNPDSIKELYQLLHSKSWSPLEPVDTLELLSSKFLDRDIRKFAITTLQRMNDEELGLYLPQLVQALKHEPNHYSSLAKFLLRRVQLNRQQMPYQFFWYLKVEISNLNVHLHSQWIERYQLILEAFLRGNPKISELSKQYDMYLKLKSVALGVKNVTNNKRKDYLLSQFSTIKFPNDFNLLFNQEYKAKGIDIESCKVKESKTLPLWLSFYNYDPMGDNILAIFKCGDDLRQDQLTLQMIDLMDRMWLAEGIDLQTISYRCVATGLNEGMIEVVGESKTIADIQKLTGKNAAVAAFSETAIASWLKQVNPSEFEYNSAVENFVRSCAGCCVYTFILGIGDRHNDNIMLTKAGHLFHIDFGRFLGNVQTWQGIKRERAPFVFPPSFNLIIGEHYKHFEELCGRAYNIIRKKAHIFLNLFLMMVSTGMPELNHQDDILYLRDSLALELTSDQAYEKFSQMIEQSLGSKTTGVNFAVHLLAN
ncbi:hypothetical protein DFA_00682 [Cavenderia fasciculata]|uniref:Phosphatidylinositol 3-kinase n=1 Tax=Cavenderia fasciculata TaxID=261658 RepID=F4PT81_CACFS|nr:uncharacterized protein DFA_00682 [Cavenderia fasciculata]EGG20817.1 hypothetical protein DFA_00682 [Cavenderia fasciculata]|eukprot:XP_004358667.1 hypothetical protein DFA_00682 [Cavenderia fasciculata]